MPHPTTDMYEDTVFNHSDMKMFSSGDTQSEGMSGTDKFRDGPDAYFARCMWYGELFHKCTLAEALFRKAKDSSRGEDLQAELTQALIDFPYADCIDLVDAIKAIDVPDGPQCRKSKSHAILKTKIGGLLDKGEPGLRHRLVSLIQARGIDGPISVRGDHNLPSSPSSIDSVDEDAEKLLPMFSMQLNEWKSRKNKIVEFDARHASIDPPKWEVLCRVEGDTFRGVAKNQKRARHLAAKKAIEELKLDV